MTATRENKEALDVPDDTRLIETNRVNEKVQMEEGSSIIRRQTYGDAFILSSSQNGVLATDTLGASTRVTTTESIVNVNSVFREQFRDITFQDITQQNTADWDTSTGRLKMSSSSNHATVYNTIANFSSIALNDGTVATITLLADETKFGNDSIRYFLTADSGDTTYEEVFNNIEITLANTGIDMLARIIMVGNGGRDTFIENFRVMY